VTIPYARLLLATEHTEFDAGAERVALDLARQRGAPLAVVVPIVSNDVYESVAPELVTRVEEEVHARLVALREEAARAGVDVDARVRRGEEPWREIVAEAEARNADLVIVRRRGHRSFFGKLLVGEMVGKVATAAPCSVLMVPRAGRSWSRRVLAGVDDTPVGPAVAQAAARLAVAARLPLVVASVAVQDTPAGRAAAEAAVAAAAALAQEEGADVERRVAVGRAPEAMTELAAASGADLVVVGRGSAGRRLHLGGNAHRIVGLAACPVLVVRT
jgi:nucleotide-binding universal stress UspA family protein